MLIRFINCDYKYETEAVTKLFFPLEHFKFLFDDSRSDETDHITVTKTDTLTISVKTGDSPERRAEYPVGNSKKENESTVGRGLFELLCEITGKAPEWGCLTGIRPVRKVNDLLDEGCSREECFERLKAAYHISGNKFALLYDTAITQRPAVKALDPKSYSLYIGIPFCPSRCSYCSFVSHSIASRGALKLMGEYVDKLTEELKLTAQIAAKSGLHPNTVYIGGGTPTTLSAEDISQVIGTVRAEFDLSKCAEFTVEAGRPDTITEEKLKALKENGVTRISVNPQTLSDEVLKNIGRIHSTEQFYDAFAAARKCGFDNINCDTIAGLPGDTPEGFCDTLRKLRELSPEGITVHTLTVKNGARLSGCTRDDLAADEWVSRETDFGYRFLKESGYSPYYLYRQKNTIGNLENTGYAKPGFECLYNIYIMDEQQSILAAGCGGSTKIVSPDGCIRRYFNYKYPYEYISRYDTMMNYKQNGELLRILTESCAEI